MHFYPIFVLAIYLMNCNTLLEYCNKLQHSFCRNVTPLVQNDIFKFGGERVQHVQSNVFSAVTQ